MKNIILLSDGTGNGAAKKERTNVWQLYNALDLHNKSQIAYYDDGVGSQEFLPLKILGGAFGFGLKSNVLELYKFLCRNYKTYDDGSTDKIYLFGFSRGAYTVRIVAGFIARCGLYTEYKDEADLDKRTSNNYDLFRKGFNNRGLSKLICKMKDIKEIKEGTIYPDIEFIGVWDTVDAYGFPIDEITSWWDRYIFPIRFPDQKLSPKVKRAKQALCIDDERHTFHPIMWDESEESVLTKKGNVAQNRIEQVWFAGMHSNVGGGYPMNNLSMVSLDWMISNIESNNARPDGLQFIPKLREEIHQHSDWHGMQHDSRSGVGAYYRYEPRMLSELYPEGMRDVNSKGPKIHFSVLERIKDNVVTYAPLGLPVRYEVVSTEDNVSQAYESEEDAKVRVGALSEAIQVIPLRKRLYKKILFTTFLFIGFLIMINSKSDEKPGEADGFFSNLIMSILPDFIVGWFKVLIGNPILLMIFIIFVVVFFLLFSKKRKLWRETNMKATNAWSVLKGNLDEVN